MKTPGRARSVRSAWPTVARSANVIHVRAVSSPHHAFACQEKLNGLTITRTMLGVSVDRSEATPLHDQVAAEIRRAIADGEAGPGDRLPLAKDLAAVLGVNKNTVLRALHVLREEGLLEFRRGRGITVAGTPDRSAMVERVRELLEFARGQGYRPDDVVQLIGTVSRDVP